jgi:hypothetical protein
MENNTLPPVVYDDVTSILLLYKNGDLAEDQLIFPYYHSPAHKAAGKVSWVHRDTLKNLLIMDGVYPGSNNQKGAR